MQSPLTTKEGKGKGSPSRASNRDEGVCFEVERGCVYWLKGNGFITVRPHIHCEVNSKGSVKKPIF